MIVAIITIVVKLRKKEPTSKLIFIISTLLASRILIGVLFDIYLYNTDDDSIMYIPYDYLVIAGIVGSIIVILLIIAWAKNQLSDRTRSLYFFIVLLLCMLIVFSWWRFHIEISTYAGDGWGSLCLYASIVVWWTAHLCGYLIYLLKDNEINLKEYDSLHIKA